MNNIVKYKAMTYKVFDCLNIPQNTRAYVRFEDEVSGLYMNIRFAHRVLKVRFLLKVEEDGLVNGDYLGFRVIENTGFEVPEESGKLLSFDECILIWNLWFIQNELNFIPMM